jgi:hypothetical protein
MSITASRINSTGVLFANGTFDETSVTINRTTPTTIYSAEFDETATPGVAMRQLSTGKLQVTGSFDEVTGMTLQTSANPLYMFIDGAKGDFSTVNPTIYDIGNNRNCKGFQANLPPTTLSEGPVWDPSNNGGWQFTVAPGATSGQQWIQAPDSVLNNKVSGTISMWIKPVAITRTGDYHDQGFALTSRQLDLSGTWGAFTLSAYVANNGQNAAGTLGKLYWHPVNGVNPAQSTANLTYGNIYYVAVTWSASNCKFYINGSLDSTTTGNFSIPSTSAATYSTVIGSWRFGGEYYFPFSGTIYSAAFYDTQLSDAQIAVNFDASRNRFGL